MKKWTAAALVVLLGAAIIGSCDRQPDADAYADILRRGMPADPETLDPQKGRTKQSGDILRDIGEGLMGYSRAGNVQPAAAESYTISEDGLTYTFALRPEARWSNGDPVTAEDFVFGLKRLIDPETAALYAEFMPIAGATAIRNGDADLDTLGVRAVDATTLEITLEQPTSYLLGLLTHPSTFPVHRASFEQHGEAFARPGNLVSNGAYRLVEQELGAVVRLERNEHYWNNAATCIDEVRYIIVQEMAELNQYRAGELDITDNIPPEVYAETVEQRPDEANIAPVLGVYYYGFNLTKPPFRDNPELRQALSMAIDREALVENVTGRGELPAYSWTPPGIENYESPQLPYAGLTQDERNRIARTLYEQAGYGDNNPLVTEIRYNTGETHENIALAIQDMWRTVLGVEAELVNVDFQKLLEDMRERKVTQVFRSSWFGDYTDAHTYLAVMQSDSAANMPGYASEEYDRLMKDAAAQLDPQKRRLFLEEAERVLLQEHAFIPIYVYTSKHLVNPRVKGWGDNILDYRYSQYLCLDAAR